MVTRDFSGVVVLPDGTTIADGTVTARPTGTLPGDGANGLLLPMEQTYTITDGTIDPATIIAPAWYVWTVSTDGAAVLTFRAPVADVDAPVTFQEIYTAQLGALKITPSVQDMITAGVLQVSDDLMEVIGSRSSYKRLLDGLVLAEVYFTGVVISEAPTPANIAGAPIQGVIDLLGRTEIMLTCRRKPLTGSPAGGKVALELSTDAAFTSPVQLAEYSIDSVQDMTHSDWASIPAAVQGLVYIRLITLDGGGGMFFAHEIGVFYR